MQINKISGSAILKKLARNPRKVMQEAAKKNFLAYSRYMQPDLFVADFQRNYYKVLDLFSQGKIKKLIISAPPQHGKSEGSSRKLPSYMLGKNPNLRIALGSYAATHAEDFNRDVQRIIENPDYQKIFPNTGLSGTNVVTISTNYLRNSKVFEIVGHKGWFRTVGRGGGLTGKTVDISILDDVYKDALEGNSPIVREAAWTWYTSVIRSRLHNNSQELIVFTRWHEDDIVGRIAAKEQVIDATCWADFDNIPDGAWIRVNFPAIKVGEPTELDPRQEGQPLWPERHGLAKLKSTQNLNETEFQCLYQGEPGSKEGRLYSPFKTYVEKSDYGTFVRKGNYTDVADEGTDFLASGCFDIYKSPHTTFNEKTKKHEHILFALMTDVIYTQASTEETTITVPRMINENGTEVAHIESNAGGAQFEKTIKPKVKALTKPFYQGGNKEARITTASGMVNRSIIWPFGWETKFPQVYEHVTKFQKAFKSNKNDDIEDMLTGIYEKEIAPGNIKPYSQMARGIKVHR